MTTPTISAYSGTLSNGNTVTLTTTFALDEDVTDWIPDLKSGSSPGAGYLHTGASPTADNWFSAQSTYTTTNQLIGSKAMVGTVSGSSPPSINGAEDTLQVPTQTTGMMGWRGYFLTVTGNGGEFPAQYSKCMWLGNSPNPCFLDWGLAAAGHSWDHLQWVYDGSLNTNTTTGFSEWQDNTWHCIEWVIPQATGSGTSYIWMDNVLLDQRTTGGSQRSSSWVSWTTNLADTSAGFTQTYYKSGSVIAQGTRNAWGTAGRIGPACMVHLSDSATWGVGTQVLQYFKGAITDNSLPFGYNDTGLSGTNRWVFVTNNQNQRSNAFLLSGSQPATDIVIPSARVARSSQRIWTYQ